MTPLELATSMVGTREGDVKLNDYLTTGGQNLDPVSLAWCAAFVNATLEQGGYGGTGSNMARSFLDYGSTVDPKDIAAGDIGVWPRGSDPALGHVGIVQAYDPATGQVTLVSGNTSDKVGVGAYNASQALGFRRPTKGPGGPVEAAGGGRGSETGAAARPALATAAPSGPVEAAGGGAGSDAPATPYTPPAASPVAGKGISDWDAGFAGAVGEMGGKAPQIAKVPQIAAQSLPGLPGMPSADVVAPEQKRMQLAALMQRLNSGQLWA